MPSIQTVIGVLHRVYSIEELAILSVGNPGKLLQASQHVISVREESGNERLISR